MHTTDRVATNLEMLVAQLAAERRRNSRDEGTDHH